MVSCALCCITVEAGGIAPYGECTGHPSSSPQFSLVNWRSFFATAFIILSGSALISVSSISSLVSIFSLQIEDFVLSKNANPSLMAPSFPRMILDL